MNIKRSLSLLTILLLLFANVEQTPGQGKIELDDRDNYAQQANALFQKGNWEEGKKIVDDGLAKYPKDSDLKMLLGKYYFEKKNYEQARFELNKSLQYNRNNVSAKQVLVNVEVETKRYSSAICYINELLEVNPYWKGLWRKKIEVYRLQGNHVEANRLLKRISQIYPDDQSIKAAYLHYVEQEALQKKNEGKINEAIDLAASLVNEDPQNESFYLELINNYLKAGDYEKALINAEKGLYNLPNSVKLIDKKADILAAQNRYDEVLSFIQLNIKMGNNSGHLSQRYNYFLEEAARHYHQTDPYTLYKMLFQRNPRNQDAFNYVVSNAISKGFYEDALEAIQTSKKINGESKNLLAKERHVYELMGMQSKVDQITVSLYQSYPDDTDVVDQYTSYRLRQAKSDMQDGLYEKALNHWKFIVEYGDAELQKTALVSIYNCSYQLNNHNEALLALGKLINEYPDELEWGMKRADIYGKQKRYEKALDEYERVLKQTDPIDMDRSLSGYEELATVFAKQLIEDYKLEEAQTLIDRWLKTNPKSEAAARYGINISAQMNKPERMAEYALTGLESKPDETFYQVKLGEAYNMQKEHKQSLDILTSEIAKNPYHKDLIATHSQAYEDYARQLLKDAKYEESLSALSQALSYDPKNKSLKYWKGVAFEKMHKFDSAYYYQSFYEPSLMELTDFTNHLKYLKNKIYKNQIGLFYLGSRFDNIDNISSITTVEYLRFEETDTYAARVNYAGRQNGKGIQAQLEWSHPWRHDIRTRFDAAVANKIFSSVMFNAYIYKALKHDWELGVGAGYRKMADKKNMLNVKGIASKELGQWWLDAQFNNIILDGNWYYSLFTRARFHFLSPKSYLTAMCSFGSAPDVEIIDNQLYNAFSVTNSMVGFGAYHLINESFSIGLLGNWYNYKDSSYKYEEGKGNYRNLYSIYLQLHVNF
ncbi:tetratricopeptide repeat protein [Dysgonomonas sp. 520]|uniref:tetratricopeptide repeat protein n=1 Tax=Dysgonomonas sp. 520 TaxID=2302931 RepID=UPI0013D47202|nr:tetratricopeptide repeat protein [Dysgonomonas sp. 520]